MTAYDSDVHEEETAVELFAKNIMVAGQVFLDSPMAVSYTHLTLPTTPYV